MITEKEMANELLVVLLKHFDEFEASYTTPTFVCINDKYLEILKRYFPYFFSDGKFVHQDKMYDILLTNKEMIGLSMSFYTEHVDGQSA